VVAGRVCCGAGLEGAADGREGARPPPDLP
jgi:hypothetical protein